MERGRRGAGRVAFLAVLPQVAIEVRAGWTLVAIFDKYRDQLHGLKNRQFERYVRRYVQTVARSARRLRDLRPSADEAERAGAANPRPAPSVESSGLVDLGAFSSRAVDLEELARVYKQKGR
jgi:hypothetical protein